MTTPRVGTFLQFNPHHVDPRDVLYEHLDEVFIVTWIDEDELLTMHNYPFDMPKTVVLMGIEPRLLQAPTFR